MTLAGVVVALSPVSDRRSRPGSARPRRSRSFRPLPVLIAEAALAGGIEDVVVVTNDAQSAPLYPDAVTVLLDESAEPSPASALRAAVDFCARDGHDAVVVGLVPPVASSAPVDPMLWRAVAAPGGGPVVIGVVAGRRSGPVRIDAQAWPLLPLTGAVEALWRVRPELVTEAVAGVVASGGVAEPGGAGAVVSGEVSDVAAVTALLGRRPAGRFTVVVRDGAGGPVVIENAPLLDDGTPMPTLYWLVGRSEREAVARLESAGGVKAAEAAIPADELAAAHRRYAEARDVLLPAQHEGPRPTGGVGGTRTGVKCLHAHLAAYLAGTGDPVGRWVVGEIGDEIDGPVAAIDCGTNSTRLLIVGRDGETVRREMRITRLGEGVDRTGELTPGAIGRTVEALRAYREAMDHAGVVAWRATATSAARDASNHDALFDAAADVLGARLHLISGDEEGSLSYRGATKDLDASDGPFLVVDLGGGSTELAAATGDGAIVARSLDMGCVRITERFLRSDPPSSSEIDEAALYIAGLIDGALAELPSLRAAATLVGVAGTVATLVLTDSGIATYDRADVHGRHLTLARVADLADELLAEPSVRRLERPGIEAGRADVIAAGALILAEVMERTGHDELIASESDILDGITDELRAKRRR